MWDATKNQWCHYVLQGGRLFEFDVCKELQTQVCTFLNPLIEPTIQLYAPPRIRRQDTIKFVLCYLQTVVRFHVRAVKHVLESIDTAYTCCQARS